MRKCIGMADKEKEESFEMRTLEGPIEKYIRELESLIYIYD